MKRGPDVAAAVPYRCTDDGPRFLLVRTKGGDKWTFPKGHKEKNESLAEAAVREAREEAGIEGKIDGKRLAKYRYPDGSASGRKKDYRVAAFLLEVHTEGLERTGTDALRELAWTGPDEARRLLEEKRKGKEHKYAKKMKRVIDAAVETIARHAN